MGWDGWDGWDGRLSPSASLLRAPYGANNVQSDIDPEKKLNCCFWIMVIGGWYNHNHIWAGDFQFYLVRDLKFLHLSFISVRVTFYFLPTIFKNSFKDLLDIFFWPLKKLSMKLFEGWNKCWAWNSIIKYRRWQILTVGGLLKSNYNSC